LCGRLRGEEQSCDEVIPVAPAAFGTFGRRRYVVVELILSEPAADRSMAGGEPLEELVIIHVAEIHDSFLAGAAEAALGFGDILFHLSVHGAGMLRRIVGFIRRVLSIGCGDGWLYIGWG